MYAPVHFGVSGSVEGSCQLIKCMICDTYRRLLLTDDKRCFAIAPMSLAGHLPLKCMTFPKIPCAGFSACAKNNYICNYVDPCFAVVRVLCAETLQL